MAKNLSELLELAAVVRDETGAEENTAVRVGGALAAIVAFLSQAVMAGDVTASASPTGVALRFTLHTDDGTPYYRDVTIPPATAQTAGLLAPADKSKLDTYPKTWAEATATLPPDGSVTEAKLAANAVTSVKIAAGAVTSAKIADNSVGETKLAANAVTSVKIAAGAVNLEKIADNSIRGRHILEGVIDETKLAAGAVTSVKIAAGAVNWQKMSDKSISWNNLGDDLRKRLEGYGSDIEQLKASGGGGGGGFIIIE